MRLLKKAINFKIEPEKAPLASGIFTVVIAILAFATTFSHSSASLKSVIGPVTVPRAVSLLIFALGVVQIIRHFVSKKSAPEDKREEKPSAPAAEEEGLDRMKLFRVLTPWISFAYIALYISLMKPIGFTLSSVIYLTLQIPLLSVDFSKKSWLKALLIGAITSVVVFLIFAKGFGLRLPTNGWGF